MSSAHAAATAPEQNLNNGKAARCGPDAHDGYPMPSEKPLTLLFLTGSTLSVDRRTILRMMTDPYAVFIMFFAANIIRSINVLLLDLPLGLSETLVLSLGLAVILWATMVTLGLALAWLGEVNGRTIIAPVPLVAFAGIVINDVAILWGYSRVFEMEVWTFATVSKIILMNFSLHLGFELFFSAIVVPRLRQRYGDGPRYEPAGRGPGCAPTGFGEEAVPLARPESPRVLVGGEAIAAHEIKLVEADEHYVFVHFSDVKLHVRESFGSLVRMLGNSPGMQVHKSYWVAFGHIRDVEPKRDGSLTLTLRDATTVPVARGRARAFRQKYGFWTARHKVPQP